MNLVYVVLSWKKGSSQVQLNNDTAKREHINSTGILLCAQQILRGPIPSSRNVISRNLITFDGQAKINKLDNGQFPINKDILRFDITMDNPMRMHTV